MSARIFRPPTTGYDPTLEQRLEAANHGCSPSSRADSAPLRSPQGAPLPDELQQRLIPGSTIYWRIVERAELERRESALFRFQLAAESPSHP